MYRPKDVQKINFLTVTLPAPVCASMIKTGALFFTLLKFVKKIIEQISYPFIERLCDFYQRFSADLEGIIPEPDVKNAKNIFYYRFH